MSLTVIPSDEVRAEVHLPTTDLRAESAVVLPEAAADAAGQ